MVAFVLWGVWLIVHELSQQNHYKRLQYTAHSIFQAEQAHYVEYGKYTANMEKLDVELPIMAHEQYTKGGYAYDNGEKVETPEMYSAYTAKGDSFVVQVMGVEDDPKALNLSTVLEISVSGKFGTLPASYSIRHFFGTDQPEMPVLFQCDVTILHAETEVQAEKDIRKGGRFCKRLGAQPTDNPLIWLF
ncbi:MAG: hypothetical protein J6Y17_02675 [Elusimicrobiaceae bacterium]|nr:hypothetical protein [Elusimicrobiaceae bacterium]